MDIYKISKFEAICLVCIIVVNHIIINIPETIIQSTGSSAWINVIFISLIAIGITCGICKLFNKFSGKDILDLSEYVGGKFLKFVVGVAYIALFAIISSMLIRYFCTRSKNNIFPSYSNLCTSYHIFIRNFNCKQVGI